MPENAVASSSLNVLVVSAGLAAVVGGPPTATIEACLALNDENVRITLVTPTRNDPGEQGAIDRLRAAGVALRAFPLARVLPRWSVGFRLAGWILRRARRFDVIHAHGAWTFTTLVAVAAARLHRRPAVLTPHESLTDFDVSKSSAPARATKRVLRRLYLNAFDLVVFASPLEHRDSLPNGRTRAIVVPHPVPGRVGSPRGQRRGPLRVGFLGRFHPKKNLALLIRALPDSAFLRVAGDGPEIDRARLRRIADEVGAAERVEWLGFVGAADRADFFDSIDLLAMPSSYESFGLAAAEALAAGVPVLVTPRVGVASLVAEHACGYVVDPVVEDVHRVLLAAGDLTELSARALRAARDLDPRTYAAELVRVYAHLAGSQRNGAS